MSEVPVFDAAQVERAVAPAEAVEAIREAFVAHARALWTMPAKLYLTNYPAGDFRAMPALGGGYALLKWVSSFPGNPRHGLPTVSGAVLLSDAETGELKAILDAAAVTALRTGAAAVLAADTLARSDARSVAVIGVGVNGQATARTFIARGYSVGVWDVDRERASAAAAALGASLFGRREDALAADVVVSVTPGHELVFAEGSLLGGQHLSLMGADGPGKAEIAAAELLRASAPLSGAAREPGQARLRLFCDDWEQASHSGDLAQVAQTGQIGRDRVTELGEVLLKPELGRHSPDEITVFDSTGLAIQDLAIAILCLRRAEQVEPTTVTL